MYVSNEKIPGKMPGLLTDFTISELLAENQQGHLPISSASTHPDYGQKRRRTFF